MSWIWLRNYTLETGGKSFKTLYHRQHWCLPSDLCPNRAIRSCWITLKRLIFEHITVFYFPPSIRYFGVFLSLSLKQSAYFGLQNSLSHPSAISLHWPVTNFPISPHDWLMGRSRCPSLYLSWKTALCVIYLNDKCDPSSCWRTQCWKGMPGTDQAISLHLHAKSAHTSIAAAARK